MIKDIIRKLLRKFGIKLTIVGSVQQELETALTMEGGLYRCVKRGLKVNSVIDIGASSGRWSEACANYIPNARYFMVEAQSPHEPSLTALQARDSRMEFIIAAAGRENGKIYFDNTDLWGGLASETPLEGDSIQVPVVSIDSEVKKRNLQAPYLLKLDTHGFELPILEGAKETIKNAELIIIETYNYQLTQDSLKYYQMCEYMAKLGFSSIENVDLLTRKYDGSFWQMDTFFIPSNSKEFRHNSYD